jgi:hypothetical protein
LRARIAALSPEQRKELLDEKAPLAGTLPLLHLAAGGQAPDALYAITTTPAASIELTSLLAEGNATPGPELVKTLREVVRRAALHFLKDRLADFATAEKRKAVVLCVVIDRVARSIEQRNLQLLARQIAVEEADTVANRLALAQVLAVELNAPRAREEMERARKLGAKPESRAYRLATRAATAAEGVQRDKAQAKSAEQALAVARQLLILGRNEEARFLLAPWKANAPKHLGIASAMLLAELEGSACPGLPPHVATDELCANAWEQRTASLHANDVLRAAWASQAGRDDAALEMYLGIAHVVPWMYAPAAAKREGPKAAENVFKPRLLALKTALAEITAVAPRFDGVALFVEALAAGFEAVEGAEPGTALHLPPESEAALVKHASDVATKWGDTRAGQAGVLAVAGLLVHERAASPLLNLLKVPSLEPDLSRTYASLLAWEAAVTETEADGDRARSLLAERLSELDPNSLDRARLVLMLAELDAALVRTERSFQVLAQAAGQLVSSNVPEDLALRALLDAGGAFTELKRTDEALRVFRLGAGIQVPPQAVELADQLRLIRGSLVILETREANPDVLKQKQAEISELAAKGASLSTKLWLELWGRELSARNIQAACPRKGTCAARAAKEREFPRRELIARAGKRAAVLIERGMLPSGKLELRFDFSAERGLEPEVVFEPSLPPVQLPPLVYK